MQEKPLSGTRYTLDINVVAIYLVENHPGNKYVKETIDFGIENKIEFILFDFLPLRVYWILTTKWGAEKRSSQEAIISFLDLPNIKLVSVDKEDIQKAFTMAKKINHDVYDLIYAVIALKTNSNGIITTDTDFKKICAHTNLEYINPIPKNILRRFHLYKHK